MSRTAPTPPTRCIGLIGAGWPPSVGGVESHMQDLARELVGRGWRVEVLCFDMGEGKEPYAMVRSQEGAIGITRIAYRYGDQRKLADLQRNPHLEGPVLGWAKERGLDLVHLHHPTGFGTGIVRELAGQLPTVMTLHDYWSIDPRGQMLDIDGRWHLVPDPVVWARSIAATWPHLVPSGGADAIGPAGEPLGDDVDAARAYIQFGLGSLRAATRLVTPSAAAREVFVRAGLPRDSIEVCENGVEVDGLAAEVRRLAAARPKRQPGEPLRLGVLGTVLPSKGALELAEAWAASALSSELEVHVHGNQPSYHGDGSYVARLLALAQDRPGLYVHGPYSREQLPGILAGLDAVAAPSRWEEVYGLTVREAKAAGRVVLVSKAGALPDVVESGGGLAVERDSPGAWQRALELLARDSALRARWLEGASGEAARPRTIAEMTDQLVAVYADAQKRWQPR